MNTLQEIGLKHGTDKAVTHLYLDNYEKHFSEWREKEFVLLELGVASGASLRTWSEYFPNAAIYGIDNNADCKTTDNIFIGDASDEGFLSSVLSIIGMPDIIIDDSGHVGDETIKSFEILFPLVKSGGLYCIEDCATFYSEHYSGKFESNGRSRVYNFLSDLNYHVDIAGRGMTGNVDYALSVQNPNFDAVPTYSRMLKAIHIYPSLWIYEKR